MFMFMSQAAYKFLQLKCFQQYNPTVSCYTKFTKQKEGKNKKKTNKP
jgi:hypothetical protein